MRIKFEQIRVNLHPSLYEKLVEEQRIGTTHEKSVTTIVREALDMYFNREHILNISSIRDLKPLTNPDHDKYHYPMTYKEMAEVVMGSVPTGLVIPQPKAEADPDIKQALSISSIKAGPGASQKLRSLGIDPIDVIKGKESKEPGIGVQHGPGEIFRSGMNDDLLEDLNEISNYVIGNQAPEDVGFNSRETLPESLAFLMMYPESPSGIRDSMDKMEKLSQMVESLYKKVKQLEYKKKLKFPKYRF